MNVKVVKMMDWIIIFIIQELAWLTVHKDSMKNYQPLSVSHVETAWPVTLARMIACLAHPKVTWMEMFARQNVLIITGGMSPQDYAENASNIAFYVQVHWPSIVVLAKLLIVWVITFSLLIHV